MESSSRTIRVLRKVGTSVTILGSGTVNLTVDGVAPARVNCDVDDLLLRLAYAAPTARHC